MQTAFWGVVCYLLDTGSLECVCALNAPMCIHVLTQNIHKYIHVINEKSSHSLRQIKRLYYFFFLLFFEIIFLLKSRFMVQWADGTIKTI